MTLPSTLIAACRPNRTQKLLGILFIGLSAWPAIAAADSISFDPKSWNVGQEIRITGSNLQGTYVRRKRLCLAPEAFPDRVACFGHYDDTNKVWISDDQLIKKWTDNEIVFTVPESAPVRGVLVLARSEDVEKCFGSAGCDLYPEEKQLVLGSYTARPSITAFTDVEGNAADRLEKGRKYEIRGDFFGDLQGTVLFPPKQNGYPWSQLPAADIVSWEMNRIVIAPSSDHDIGTGLKVNNGVVDSTAFVPRSASTTPPRASSATSSDGQFPPFKDVEAGSEYLPAIRWAKESGILSGYPDGTFQPDRLVNRAELLKVAFAAAKSSVPTNTGGAGTFRDTEPTAWYMPYVNAARAAGIVQGYPDGTFRPQQTVSFAEGLKIVYRALNVPVDQVDGAWYEPYLRHALSSKTLKDEKVSMTQGMSRKDVVWIVWRLMNK